MMRSLIFPMLAMLLAAGALPAKEQAGARHHEHPGPMAMDAEGRRLESYDVRHVMDQATLAALREKIALYRGMTDMELQMNMSAMGPNYEWYVSDPELRGDVGVLILAHGVGEHSDRLMRNSLKPIAERWPTAIGFGMAMMQSSHLQSAVDDLVAHGAQTIVLVPSGTTTGYNSLTRQWQYIFDIDNTPPSYLDVPKVRAPVEFVMTAHLSDHPLITEILHAHAMEVSRNPAQEMLIIVGHGPEDPADNGPDLEIISRHAERIRARGEFAEVRIVNLQDDAIRPIRESNVRKLRRWVKQAGQRGLRPIVVALAAASHGVQTHIRQDLRGLDYVFADRGLSENPKYVAWMEAAIETALAQRQASAE